MGIRKSRSDKLPRVIRVCHFCGKEFYTTAYEVDRGRGLYCSNQCSARTRKKKRPIRGELYEIYWNEKKSTPVLAEWYDVSKGTIYNWLKELGIPTRSVSKGTSIALTGKTHSPEWNAAISRGHLNMSLEKKRRQVEGLMKCNRKYGRRSKSGHRKDIGIYVRSSWEANYCRYLNWLQAKGQIKRWEYEADTFEFPVKRGSRFYTPDFKVFQNDGSVEYYEVKGWLDQKSQTKLKRMRKYYPDVTVVLIDGSVYADLKRIFKTVLPGWE